MIVILRPLSTHNPNIPMGGLTHALKNSPGGSKESAWSTKRINELQARLQEAALVVRASEAQAEEDHAQFLHRDSEFQTAKSEWAKVRAEMEAEREILQQELAEQVMQVSARE